MDVQQIDILFRLLIAHLLADFLLQPDIMATEKKKGLVSRYYYLHILTVGILTYLLLGQWTNWQGPLIIMVVHGTIDAVKAARASKYKWANSSQKWFFIIDQLLHVLTLIVYWMIATEAVKN